jgi:hypothetical protein
MPSHLLDSGGSMSQGQGPASGLPPFDLARGRDVRILTPVLIRGQPARLIKSPSGSSCRTVASSPWEKVGGDGVRVSDDYDPSVYLKGSRSGGPSTSLAKPRSCPKPSRHRRFTFSASGTAIYPLRYMRKPLKAYGRAAAR